MKNIPNRSNQEEKATVKWFIKGELFLNCNCDVFCPCVVSLGVHAPTQGYCQAWMAAAITQGMYDGHDLSGLNVGMLVDIPGRMSEGNWRMVLYIDDRASPQAFEGLKSIFSGHVGGNIGVLSVLVSEVIGVHRERVEIEIADRTRSVKIGKKVAGTVEMITGRDSNQPVKVTNAKYWMGPEITVAKGVDSKVRDYGRAWNLDGKSAEICSIDWSYDKR